ncbi:hypothetical protein MKW98_031934 [Papaver atlanticum]|uniref:Signal recognition particle receptor subunit beta n=1 Tax=Papaver atlanticum TaxID=357466 RepID=A0AAD4SG48_9MAGN|nr:hypothetical protein MKW98_031934 [Papaver atlanticum]
MDMEQNYVAVGVLVFTFVFFFLIGLFKRSKSDTILLAGLSGSGKTVLFYKLRDGSELEKKTVTSMDPNEGDFVLHSEFSKKGKIRPVRVIDVPGDSGLRAKLDEYLPQAAGLIFVVDAVGFSTNCRAAAEYLYEILTNALVVKKKVPVLIMCNKSDKKNADTKEFIWKQLEKEIDKLRASRTAVSAADMSTEYALGVAGETFKFSQCRNKVSVGESSGLTGKISLVELFIREHVY